MPLLLRFQLSMALLLLPCCCWCCHCQHLASNHSAEEDVNATALTTEADWDFFARPIDPDQSNGTNRVIGLVLGISFGILALVTIGVLTSVVLLALYRTGRLPCCKTAVQTDQSF